MVLYLCNLSPPNPKPQSKLEKNPRQNPVGEHLVIDLTDTPPVCQEHQTERKVYEIVTSKKA